jgi:hypothetical protein
LRLDAARLADDLGRLPGARQVGGVDLADALTHQAPRSGGGLRATLWRERTIEVALPPLLAVPVGLAMTDEVEQGHAGDPCNPNLTFS